MLNLDWHISILAKPLTAVASTFILCSSTFYPQVSLAQSLRTLPDAQQTNNFQETPYTLGPGDRLRLDILDSKEINGEYSVLVDGTVTFPLVGTLQVQDKTLSELTQVLSQKYSQYFKRPLLTVGLISPRPLKITISGEISTPGTYTLGVAQNQKFPFLTDVIKQSGGTTTAADASAVKIVRQYKGQTQIYTLNLFTLLQKGETSQDISLRDGDSIFIPTKQTIDQKEIRQLSEANFGIQAGRPVTVAIVGQVVRPGTYRLDSSGPSPTDTTNSTSSPRGNQLSRVSEALQKAGGTKPLANIRLVEVQRRDRSGNVQTIPVDLWALLQSGSLEQDIVLQDGDVITVPKAENIDPKESEALASANFAPSRIRVNVVGEVVKPGVAEIPPNTPLNQAILIAGGFDARRANQDSVKLIRLNPNGTVSARDISVNLSGSVSEENNPILRDSDVVLVSRSVLAEVTDTIGTVFSPFAPILGVLGTFNVFNNSGR